MRNVVQKCKIALDEAECYLLPVLRVPLCHSTTPHHKSILHPKYCDVTVGFLVMGLDTVM